MEKKQQQLEWFVQFANLNLDELTPGDMAKFGVESEQILFPKRELEVFPPPADGTEYSRRLEQEMHWAFKAPERDSPEYWSLIRRLQNVAKKTLLEVATYHSREKEVQDAAMIVPWRAESIQTLVLWGWDAEKIFRFYSIPLTQSHDGYVRIKLYHLLNSIRRSTLQICPAPKRKNKICGKFFLNFSRREKRFCSPRCMWRFNTEKRRKGNLEGYNQNQEAVVEDKSETVTAMPPTQKLESSVANTDAVPTTCRRVMRLRKTVENKVP